MEDGLTLVCRCSDVTLLQVRDMISQGYVTVDEIKRLLRIGMGPCQGRTCAGILQQEIARMTGLPIGDVLPGRYRPPLRAIKLGIIADNREEDHA